tara:strand:+ start:235 stop:489 length:255 start_codon:yes stop_codon:yes gene_type:complete
MIVYQGTFVKKDGSQRTMKFIKTKDLPKDFLSAKLKGTGKQNNLGESKELVWDLDHQDFRIFNYETTVGKVTKHADINKDKLAS